MITGRVNERHEATIPVTLAAPVDRELHDFIAIIDTGLDYHLALPNTVATRLGYHPIPEPISMIMGNERRHEFDRSFVAMLWDDQPMSVPALVSDSEEILVGNRLLAGCYLTAVMVPGGRVTISRLPTPEPQREEIS